MTIKNGLHIYYLKGLLLKSNNNTRFSQKTRLNTLKMIFTCFSRCKYVKNTRNSSSLSNSTAIRQKRL